MLAHRPFDENRGARTPARALLRSRALQENTGTHGLPKTVNNRTGKHAQSFLPATLQPERLFKQGASKAGGSKSKATTLVTVDGPALPLGDKTPFPNRARPRPSSTRKSLRGTPLKTNAKEQLAPDRFQQFQTPATNGNHWDVSDTSLTLESASEQEAEEEKEDYDEIEYMPPKQPDLAYDPPFELPDYKEVGKAIMDFASYDGLLHGYTWNPHLKFEDAPSDFFAGPSLSLPELEDDDPFTKHAKPPAGNLPVETKEKPKPTGRLAPTSTHRAAAASSSIPTATHIARPAISTMSKRIVSTPAARPAARPVTTVTRPAPTRSTALGDGGARPVKAIVSQPPRPRTATSIRPPASSGSVHATRPVTSMARRTPATSHAMTSKTLGRTAPTTRPPPAAKADDVLDFDLDSGDLVGEDFQFDA
ncbi:hypothetical protein CONPUDRAFT_164471 [Coniophora puteana RWD-64-598 SS2]|uniref:Uncharacterized protein n=1 Tax=Coniophora puteana (strain RWD-64-598) TaxID=741705 RepID=A0A5M3MWQ6_CONPW|nr:uncharacterized protein CONPUDRAFT_164471 [Coniophora puteana RWD-64-598 SS2]EIW83556.1 hypothetical protein CONPUDRAFT_164471 [Coniophora puteana RWD-64-598 SS2]